MVSPLPVLEDKTLFARGDTSITPAPEEISRLVIYLVKPSRYDDDGYLVRHWRGVLPSNTLSCLAGLTDDVVQRKVLGEHLKISTVLVDESVERMPRRKILADAGRKGTRAVVCLAGVQTNQFARATDIALEYASLGVRVMIGGFHVSGMTAMFPEGTPDIARLTDAGVTVVAGEVEDRWAALLSDVVNDRL
ncbi:MAG TPA: radical SAM protein, partial [Candidatus Latescibacteria bacterium]|nr:radical SAM protein [Candidatus Latescibacterota bacterium]